jgi:hypothetical protein
MCLPAPETASREDSGVAYALGLQTPMEERTLTLLRVLWL